MHPTIKKYTEETAKELSEKLASLSFKELETKSETVTEIPFKIVVSTESKDRDGEVVKVAGIDTTHYLKNWVVLGDHSYKIESIVGRTDKMYIKDWKMIAEWVFTDATELGKVAGELYKSWFLFASSIWFLVKERNTKSPDIIEKSELLEFSFVAVQSNRDALRIDEKLYKKWIEHGFIQELEEKGMSSSDSFQKQMKTLLEVEKLNVGRVYVIDIFKDEFVYNHYLYQNGGWGFDMNYRRSYTVDDKWTITLTGTDTEVERDRERVDATKLYEMMKELQGDMATIKQASIADDKADENIDSQKLAKEVLQEVNRITSRTLHDLKKS